MSVEETTSTAGTFGTPLVSRDTVPTTTLVFAGRFRLGIRRWAYVPFDVPAGVRRITVSARYARFTLLNGAVGNVLDLGIFDPAGWGVGPVAGFRGWSGGARTSFTISADDATPGYLHGPIQAGTWAVALGPVVLNPLGMTWELEVTLEHGGPVEPAVVAVPDATAPRDRGIAWYRGDLHLHTVHSDGERTPAQLARSARTVGLDFIASTEHNTVAANRHWPTEDVDGLLVIPGAEVTTRHGHWLAIGLPPERWVDWRYRPRDKVFGRHAAQVRRAGGLVVAAHPAVPLPSLAWRFGYHHVDAIEVWNGQWSVDDEVSLRIWDRLLRRGRRVAAVGGSDAHTVRDTVGLPQTVVLAEELSAPAIVTGLRRGRSYLAESSGVTLGVTATSGTATAGPGEVLSIRGGATVEVAVAAAPPGARVAVRTAAGVAATGTVDESGAHRLRWVPSDAAGRFVRVEVRAPRSILARMVAMSNPIWLRDG